MKNKICPFTPPHPPCQHEKIIYDGITGRYFCGKCEVELQDCDVQAAYTPRTNLRGTAGRGSWLVLTRIK